MMSCMLSMGSLYHHLYGFRLLPRFGPVCFCTCYLSCRAPCVSSPLCCMLCNCCAREVGGRSIVNSDVAQFIAPTAFCALLRAV